MRAPDPALPPWSATCEREGEWMIEWVQKQLDEAERNALAADDDRPVSFVTVSKLERAKRLARAGNVGPLRSLYPEIAEFLYPPKLKKGQRRSYRNETTIFARFGLSAVAEDVERIRTLWRQHYGRWKRRASDGPSAEQIAGLRHDLSESDVRAAIKALSR
jgi:hypothetical protein